MSGDTRSRYYVEGHVGEGEETFHTSRPSCVFSLTYALRPRKCDFLSAILCHFLSYFYTLRSYF